MISLVTSCFCGRIIGCRVEYGTGALDSRPPARSKPFSSRNGVKVKIRLCRGIGVFVFSQRGSREKCSIWALFIHISLASLCSATVINPNCRSRCGFRQFLINRKIQLVVRISLFLEEKWTGSRETCGAWWASPLWVYYIWHVVVRLPFRRPEKAGPFNHQYSAACRPLLPSSATLRRPEHAAIAVDR